MTYCGGQTLHQASKLRYSHPYAAADLNQRKQKGMARKKSRVGLTQYRIQLRTLGYYE